MSTIQYMFAFLLNWPSTVDNLLNNRSIQFLNDPLINILRGIVFSIL